MSLSANAQKIIDLVKELTIVELNDLVKAMEEEFCVSAAAADCNFHAVASQLFQQGHDIG